MAETELTVKLVTPAGVAAALAAANAEGSKWLANNGQETFLHVKNASGGAINVTVEAQGAPVPVPGVGLVAIPDIVVSVPATTGDVMIGPIAPGYIDVDGYAHVTFASVTSLTIAAFRMPKVTA